LAARENHYFRHSKAIALNASSSNQLVLYRWPLHALTNYFRKQASVQLDISFKTLDITLVQTSLWETIASNMIRMTDPAINFSITPTHAANGLSTWSKVMHDYLLSINCCFNFFLLIGLVADTIIRSLIARNPLQEQSGVKCKAFFLRFIIIFIWPAPPPGTTVLYNQTGVETLQQ